MKPVQLQRSRVARPPAPRVVVASPEAFLGNWGDAGHVASEWDEYAAAAAQRVADGSRILDLGSGPTSLRPFLMRSCNYLTADFDDGTLDTVVARLDKKRFPDGDFDWVSLLGILEHVGDLAWVLRRAAQAAPSALVTYRLSAGAKPSRSAPRGTPLDRPAFCDIIDRSPWHVSDAELLDRGADYEHILFALTRS
jgi:hypothetical protein